MKRLLIAIIAIPVVVSLFGCRGSTETDENSGINDTVGQPVILYTAEVISFPELPAGYGNISNITTAEDIVFFTASTGNPSGDGTGGSFRSDTIFSMTTGGANLIKLLDYTVEPPPAAATGGGLFISAMHADGNGDIWIVETGRYYISEEPDTYRDAGSALTIRKLDSSGAGLLSADISDIAGDFGGFYISMFTVDNEGYIYIGINFISNDEMTIYVLDPDCKPLFDLKAVSLLNPFITASDGSVAFARQQNTEVHLQKIDIKGKTFGESIHLPGNVSGVFSGNNDFLVLYNDSTGLYGISNESGELVRLLNWIDAGIIPEGLNNITFLNNELIFLTKSIINSGSGEQVNELIFLAKQGSNDNKHREEIVEKKELTLGVLSMNPQLQKPVLQFNNTSTTHYITIVDYSSNTTPDDTAGALLRFSAEIIAGKIPDIFILTQMPFDRLIAQDLLEDLYPYLDADSELSRESLIESVLKATEVSEKLYMINQSFTVSTIIGSPSVLGDYPGWNMDEFRAVIDANPQADIPFGPNYTKHDFLWTLLYMNLYEYIDITSGTADFDNEDFIGLLEFINTFPSETGEFVYDPLFYREAKEEGRQIMETLVPFLSNFMLQKESFGGEIVFKGWPSADRNGSRFISHDSVAISSHAQDKDGAWAFVRTLLMEEHQRDYFSHYPINRAAFEERMQQAMEPMSFFHNDGIITVEPTQDDVDELVALINSITKVTGHGSDDMLRNIIFESATDYFNGLISAEDAARVIQSRATIFLAEQK